MTEPTFEEFRRADAARKTHEDLRIHALEAYLDTLLAEVRRAVLAAPERVPYVEDATYGGDAPELWLEHNDRLPVAAFIERVTRIRRLVDQHLAGPDDAPADPALWDAVRLNRPGTHQAAVELLAHTIRMAFACDQYATTKRLWRDRESV